MTLACDDQGHRVRQFLEGYRGTEALLRYQNGWHKLLLDSHHNNGFLFRNGRGTRRQVAFGHKLKRGSKSGEMIP